MAMRDRLDEDLKRAMKAGDKPRVSCLRMLKSKVQEREVALRGEHGLGYRLSDEEAVEVIAGYAKQRRDSIESFEQAGRDDLVAKETAELQIVQEYLPRQLSRAELEPIAREVIAETGAAGPQDLGRVMKAMMARVKGAAEGKAVNAVIRELLSGS